ncbi:MAG: ribonuclease HI family protein [Candidatus Micrarchaeota archaeon]
MLTIFTDGASFGNPGPMGIGIVIYRDGIIVEELSEYIGKGTNNIAEYTAVVRALETVHEMGEMDAHIKCDSQLIVCQLNGEYKVKDAGLKPLKERIDRLRKGLNVKFEHIPREKNAEADELSKKAAELGKKREAEEKRGKGGAG